MASDRAARVARLVKRWKDCVWSPRSQGTLMRDDVLCLVEREVKRAVEEEREACAMTALNFHDHDDRISWICEGIERAIRARGRK